MPVEIKVKKKYHYFTSIFSYISVINVAFISKYHAKILPQRNEEAK
jgi:hypothetical protein